MATRHHAPLRLPLIFFKTLSPPRPLSRPFPRSPARSFAVSSMASPPSSKKVLVPIANGTEPMEAVIIIDVLRRSGADVTVASVEKDLRVDACWGVKLVADALVADCAGSAFDLISLPGGMPGAANLRDCGVLESMVKKHAEKGGLYSAICAAPAVALGSWGLLKGLKVEVLITFLSLIKVLFLQQATCYPSFMDKLPSDTVAVESRVQVDGKAVTSRGAGTAVEFSLVLIEHLYGKDKAAEVAGPLVMRPHHGVEFTMKELNRVEWKFNGTPNILVPIANGSEEMEAVMIIDILRRAKANVTVASVEDKLEIVASRKVKIVADTLLHDASKQQYDLIVLPGGLGGAKAFANSETLINLLKKQAGSNKLYGAICASPAIALEPHGLLKGKKATAFPPMCDKLSDQSECKNRVVVDGNLITSRGPGTAMEFSLVIVEKFFGREKALDLAKSLVFM
ncbi:Protein DJ- B [Ananas comosus]|uniref:Protein DJ-B n=1 Tax=Ananas comosus TaxID=4615 RepID=A0A199WAD0_ANACO|nr:Protein DJ- B [Ananas comosus]